MSGLYPLSELSNMGTLTTKCIKPGQGLYNSTSTVRDSMVSFCAHSSRGLRLRPGPGLCWGSICSWFPGPTATCAADHVCLQCDAYGPVFTGKTWTARVSFVVYIMAIQSVMGACRTNSWSDQLGVLSKQSQPCRSALPTASLPVIGSMQDQECAVAVAGWILFLIFAGWGMFAAPIDWIFQYIRRPKSVITKSEYIDRARGLAQRAKEVKVRGLLCNMYGAIRQFGAEAAVLGLMWGRCAWTSYCCCLSACAVDG